MSYKLTVDMTPQVRQVQSKAGRTFYLQSAEAQATEDGRTLMAGALDIIIRTDSSGRPQAYPAGTYELPQGWRLVGGRYRMELQAPSFPSIDDLTRKEPKAAR